MELLWNPVVISVVVMIIISLFRINVIFALLFAGLTAGITANFTFTESIDLLVEGMGGQSNTALSYILLGMFAVMISMTNITAFLVKGIGKLFSSSRRSLVIIIAFFACFSQNLIPVHIAFIPILIPPLLSLFDQLKLDRRAVASALTFGLKFPYMTIPLGFGLIFQGLIRDELTANGMEVTLLDVTKGMVLPGLAMLVGLLIAVFITYRKDRVVNEDEVEATLAKEETKLVFTIREAVTLLAIIATLLVQIVTSSLVLGALTGVVIMFVFNVISLRKTDDIVAKGIAMMGTIAFVMLIASGYANVLKNTGAIDGLVESTIQFTGDSPFLVSVTLLTVGLLITLGIGTSFGTVPILAALYTPILIATGMSPLASIALIGTAAAIGDAGSPASDSTLGPTSGLNADGKHHHIWDTVVPTFLHYNIPLFIFGIIAGLVL